MRIHIIGCSGSGKFFLAHCLSEKYRIPHFDLDEIQWENSGTYGVKRPVTVREEMLREIVSQDSWIIEGVYYSWVSASFEKADVIYVLDLPLSLCRVRIMARSIKRKLRHEPGKKETLKSVISLLRWTDTFKKKNMREIRELMEQYREKAIWISCPKEVNQIIRALDD